MPEFKKVAERSEIPEGEARAIEVDGKRVAVFNVGGAFYAIDDSCPHQGGPLSEGELDGTIVTCPWHAWMYDVSTGVNTDDETCTVQKYDVKVEGASILLAL